MDKKEGKNSETNGSLFDSLLNIILQNKDTKWFQFISRHQGAVIVFLIIFGLLLMAVPFALIILKVLK